MITTLKDMDIVKKKYNDLQDDYKQLKDRFERDIANCQESYKKSTQELEDVRRHCKGLEQDKKALEQQMISTGWRKA